MANTRKAPTPNQLLVLYNQVDAVCPYCADPLVTKKKKKNHVKAFEVAHIYPLNPLPHEEELLKLEERLGTDLNDLDNLIPLCESCHGVFDKERTVEEYRELVRIKKAAIGLDQERSMWHKYTVEEELVAIVNALAEMCDDELANTALGFTPQSVSEKTSECVSPLTQRRIRNDVQYYFPFLRTQFRYLEERDPKTADLIAAQVRVFAIATSKSLEGEDLYYSVVRWIERRVSCSQESARVLASFFVQNCEVLS